MIAIQSTPGGFSDRWIEYFNQRSVSYRIVDCYRSDILQQLVGCQGLMWHWPHHDQKAALFARQLTFSLELAGLRVFPDSATSWHYDDKLGQKYLLEAVGLPAVPTHAFFDRTQALQWASSTSYPKVFKLRGGAGAENVRLVRDAGQARILIRRAFGRGIKQKSRLYLLRERLWHVRRDRTLKSLWNVWRGVARLMIPTADERAGGVERHYAYFQDFIPNNDHDIRVVVIGRRAFAIKRMTRDGDFRASGSGHLIYDPDAIPKVCVKAAFEAAQRLKTQCVALDFVFQEGEALIVEISYAFASAAYLACPGYWDGDLNWHESSVVPEHFMAEDFVRDTMTTSVAGASAP